MTNNSYSNASLVGHGRLRRLHVSLSLHPMSIMTMMCVGVLLVAATLSVFATNYSVTASVPGPIPTTPAIITSPTDGQHFTSADQTFSGSCPDTTYVTLFINGSVAGSAWCSASSFSIITTLPAGASTAQAQDYNSLNQAGPVSGMITAYYDPPVTPPTPQPTPTPTPSPTPVTNTPIELSVADADTTMPYKSYQGAVVTHSLPILYGTAPPFSKVTVEIYNSPVFCRATANAYGYWNCPVKTILPNGFHSVYVSAVTQDGRQLSVPMFKIFVISEAASQPALPAPGGPKITMPPFSFQVYPAGQAAPLNFSVNGGTAPYSIFIDWRDGQTASAVQQAYGSASFSHVYANNKQEFMNYEAYIRVIDANGKTTIYQVPILVRSESTPVAIAPTTSGSPLERFLAGLHNWLWLLWPGYLIVGLMLFSFFLGERREHDQERIALARRSADIIQPHRDKHA